MMPKLPNWEILVALIIATLIVILTWNNNFKQDTPYFDYPQNTNTSRLA